MLRTLVRTPAHFPESIRSGEDHFACSRDCPAEGAFCLRWFLPLLSPHSGSVYRRQRYCFVQKGLISHRISQHKQSPLLSYRLTPPTTANHSISLQCPASTKPLLPKPSPTSATVVNSMRSPMLSTKVGAAPRRSSQHSPRCLTCHPYPTVNVQTLKLWDDESEFDAEKDKARFRQYEDACDRVKNFYKEQHGTIRCLIALHRISPSTTTEKQTVAFNIQARVNFKSRRRARMGIWEAMEMLNTLVDESDPDVSVCDIDPK